MPMDEYRFLLTGGVSMQDPPAKPVEWVPVRRVGPLPEATLYPEFSSAPARRTKTRKSGGGCCSSPLGLPLASVGEAPFSAAFENSDCAAPGAEISTTI